MSDEAAALRAALEHGEWRRLTDPLLDLVLLEQPDPRWWARLTETCALRMANETTWRLYPEWPWLWDVVRPWAEGLLGPLEGYDSDFAAVLYNSVAWTDPEAAAQRVLVRVPARPDGSDPRPRAALELARQLVASTRPRHDLEEALAVLERWPAG